MATFTYTAVDVDGAVVSSKITAPDELEARRALLHANLAVQSIMERKSLLQRDLMGSSVSPSEVLHFSRQMSAFIRSGLSVVDGLDLIATSSGNKKFAAALLNVRDSVRQGVPFHEALGVYSSFLPRYYLGIVRSAELTGRLDLALEQLAEYMEREIDAKSRVKSAVTYPLIVVAMSFAAVVILTVWVLPKFVVFFEELGTDLPWTTRTLLSVASWSQSLWFLYVLFAVAVVALWGWTKRSVKGRSVRDHLMLKLPVAGEIVLYAGVERVCRILATMWEAGVPIPEAMTAAIEGADNAVFEERLAPAQEAVMSGEGLAGPLGDSGLFPAAALQMIAVGEATGTLTEQLENSAEFYSRELDHKLKRLTTLFEPAIIVVVGLVVGFVALALVEAMYGSFKTTAKV